MNDKEILEKIQNYTGLSFRALAQKIGIKGPQIFYDIKSGKCGISFRLASSINKAFPEIRLDWILSGDGYFMEKPDKNPLFFRYVELGATKDVIQEILNILNYYAVSYDLESNPTAKEAIIEHLGSIVKKYSNQLIGLLDELIRMDKKYYGFAVSEFTKRKEELERTPAYMRKEEASKKSQEARGKMSSSQLVEDDLF